MTETATGVFARVTDTPIDEAAVREAVNAPDCGAVTLFHGVIRNHDGGEDVRALDYSSHPLAEELLAKVVREETERTGVRLAAWHRVGSLEIGDAALVAAAASAHRAEAFAAIETLVERIKTEVPIWKRQHYTSGSSDWVGL
ncbi:molybdenum cofactor biosynthesis protein MoaE [Leucobacter denitrificans]|uniref:Molybdenum cofactor biosynthesis protein MoaE n=1 Tax=Leucobacter denitrificans TaxID=683042 RepID=A0A7G9S428_9MICO|nr:molybdenum cofactor biosynthesis protein MoaE [Leucobacter denitrificans]QNN62603.1 molybdenum cofactor biosynthesis protein MoaE [Leucobacter denitrificans]